MAVQSRATQDRRNLSRVMLRLNCQFTYEEAVYNAVMVDISLKGAFFSADFLPPNNSIITVTLDSPVTQKPLVFTGRVLRGTWAMTDYGKRGRFAVSFTFAPSGLIGLINTVKS